MFGELRLCSVTHLSDFPPPFHVRIFFFDNSEKPALYVNNYCTGHRAILHDPKTLFGIIRKPLTRIIMLHFVTNPISL